MDPNDHAVLQTDWWIEIAGEVQSGVYGSRADALADVEDVLFAPWRRDSLVEQQIDEAIKEGNMPLVLRLVEGRGRAAGRAEAEVEFSAALTKVESCLKSFKRKF